MENTFLNLQKIVMFITNGAFVMVGKHNNVAALLLLGKIWDP